MIWSALGDLKANDFSFAAWEGANYYGPLIPMAVFFAISNRRAAISIARPGRN
jgi:hypothetical protein